LGSLLGSNLAETLESCSRMKDWDGNSGEDRGDDMGFPQGAGTTADEREEEAFEKSRWLVQALLETVEQVDIEFLVLVDILADFFKDHHLKESLHDNWLVRDENTSGLEAGVWCPAIWPSNFEYLLPVRNSWEDFEGFR
jgi:hypothetical protein